MKKIIIPLLWAILFSAILGAGAFFYLIHDMGKNFVHGEPSVSQVNVPVNDRIVFPERGSAAAFDSALAAFMDQHPLFKVPESIQKQVSNKNCNCLSFQRFIYFQKDEPEICLLTYDYNSGVIDLVFRQKENGWMEIQSSKLDSLDKMRIRSRFVHEVLDSLPASTHFE